MIKEEPSCRAKQSENTRLGWEAKTCPVFQACLHLSICCLFFVGVLTFCSSTLASVDLDECIERLYKKELLADSVIEAICAKTKELLMKESNVVHIAAPVTVVGDIHGQFFDMIEIFKIGGFCPDTNYLFLGELSSRPLTCSAQTLSWARFY